MRNLLTVILCSGVFFTQQAIASSQCTLKPGPDIHCSGCTTLEHFAFFGASALYSAGQQRSIQVIGDNGSNVYVSKGTYWERADIRIELGFLGTWGAENVPYPSLTYAKVYAHDTTNKIGGKLPNNGRMLYGALNAKCKEIELEKEAKEKGNKVNVRDLEPWAARYRNAISRWELAANRWLSVYDGASRVIPIVRQIELKREATSTTKEVANWSRVPNKGTGAVGTRKKEQ